MKKLNKLKCLNRGFKKKCPNCGQTPIFSKYIKTFEKCKKCAIVFTEFRSDDGPAYCTILIVGHIIIPIILLVEKNFQPKIIFQITLWPILTAFLCLWLLPRVKGAFLAFQIFVNDKQS